MSISFKSFYRTLKITIKLSYQLIYAICSQQFLVYTVLLDRPLL